LRSTREAADIWTVGSFGFLGFRVLVFFGRWAGKPGDPMCDTPIVCAPNKVAGKRLQDMCTKLISRAAGWRTRSEVKWRIGQEQHQEQEQKRRRSF